MEGAWSPLQQVVMVSLCKEQVTRLVSRVGGPLVGRQIYQH